MKLPSRFRLIFPFAALSLAFALRGFSQEPPAAAPATPPPAADPARPVVMPAPDAAPTPPPAAAEAPATQEPPLRRIDGPRRNRPNRIRSDDFPIGDHTVPRGRQTHDVVSVLGSTFVEGDVTSDVVSVGGRTTIAPGARVGGAAVAVMGRLEMQGAVGEDTVSVMGASAIDGPVGGDAVAVLGNMHLGPKAVIEGDLVVVGGTLTKDPNAVVRGEQVNVPFVTGFGDMEWLLRWVKRCVFFGRPLALGEGLGWTWSVAFGFLGFYLLLALLFPRGMVKCTETLETRPGASVLASVLSVLLTPIGLILLSITVVGALLLPFLLAGLTFAKLFGKAVMLAWIGRRFTKFFGDGPLGHPVFAVLIGGLLLMLIYTVPILGGLTFGLLTWLGFGVVMYTVAQSMKRDRPPASPRGGVPTAPVAPIVPPVAAATPAPAAAMAPTVPMTASPAMPLGIVSPPTMSAGFSEAPPPAAAGPAFPPVAPLPPPPAPPTMTEIPIVPPLSAPEIPPPAVPQAVVAPVPPPPPPAPPSVPPVAAAVAWRRAGFFPRLAALALDGVLIGMLMAFVYGILPRFLRHDSPGPWLIALAIYGAVMWKHKGTTIGGIVCGLKVVRVDNRELDWTTAIVRALGCFLSLAVAGLGFIWVAIDDDKQSWHDKIAGTTVVHVPKGVSLI